jgi:hypothetical protein
MTTRSKAEALAGIGAAVAIGFASILFFGTAIHHVVESAAACMESTNNLRECSRIDRAAFWEPVAALTILGFIVGVVCFIYGQRYRAK